MYLIAGAEGDELERTRCDDFDSTAKGGEDVDEDTIVCGVPMVMTHFSRACNKQANMLEQQLNPLTFPAHRQSHNCFHNEEISRNFETRTSITNNSSKAPTPIAGDTVSDIAIVCSSHVIQFRE